MPDAGARPAKKRAWGALNGRWVPHHLRNEVVDYVRRWSQRTQLPVTRLVRWLGVGASKFYQWQKRYGRANEHNGLVPRDWWLEDWEQAAILDYHDRHPLEGYRRLVHGYVEHYNHVRLHSALAYLTPADKLHGLAEVIFAERDRKLEEARERRRLARQTAREVA